MKIHGLMLVLCVSILVPMTAIAGADTATGYVILAAAEERQDRRQERGRADERQDKRDCRQEEGWTGEDKRECKQEEVRDGVRGHRGDSDEEDG